MSVALERIKEKVTSDDPLPTCADKRISVYVCQDSSSQSCNFTEFSMTPTYTVASDFIAPDPQIASKV